MSLKAKIDEDIKKAMLAKEKAKLTALRSIKSLILLEETKEGRTAELTEADEIQMLSKAAKQRRDSAEIYKTQNRADLMQVELEELTVIESYLPKQLSDEELRDKLSAIIEQVGAKTPADLGKVMGLASKQLAGLADGKKISETVKSLLINA